MAPGASWGHLPPPEGNKIPLAASEHSAVCAGFLHFPTIPCLFSHLSGLASVHCVQRLACKAGSAENGVRNSYAGWRRHSAIGRLQASR